ncbi:MAG: hypothetical protein AAFN11_22420 [Chloroflexota bacterium]
MADETKCPFTGGSNTSFGTTTKREWWPNQLNVRILHQNAPMTNPMGIDFDYANAFNSLDLDAVKQDLNDRNQQATNLENLSLGH